MAWRPLVCLIALLMNPALDAAAHSSLLEAIPGDGAIVAAGDVAIELRFDSPRDDAERTPVRGVVALDLLELAELEDSPGNAYGLALAKSVFADGDLRAKYGQFKAAAAGAAAGSVSEGSAAVVAAGSPPPPTRAPTPPSTPSSPT